MTGPDSDGNLDPGADPGDPDGGPELSPEHEAEVRRLLVEARPEAPMPGDVAARLDRVLAQLREDDAQGTPGQGVATVTELAARRRRRVSSLLVAAAAVVVVGVGLGQVVDTGGSSTSSDSSALDAGGSAADSGQASQSDADAALPTSAAPSAGAESYANQGQAFEKATPATVRSSDFSADVAAVLADTRAGDRNQLSEDLGSATADSPAPSDPAAADATNAFECTAAPFGAGRLVPVLYDGDPAVLAFRPPTGDTQVVDLLQCGSGELLRSVTLPSS